MRCGFVGLTQKHQSTVVLVEQSIISLCLPPPFFFQERGGETSLLKCEELGNCFSIFLGFVEFVPQAQTVNQY